jgi:hypothetical protein
VDDSVVLAAYVQTFIVKQELNVAAANYVDLRSVEKKQEVEIYTKNTMSQRYPAT